MKYIIPLIIVAVSCFPYRSKVQSYTDPAFYNKAYNRIAIFADLNNMYLQKELEAILSNQFIEKGVVAFPGTFQFPPTRNWVERDVNFELLQRKFDSKIIIKVASIEELQRVQPKRVVTRVRTTSKARTKIDTVKRRSVNEEVTTTVSDQTLETNVHPSQLIISYRTTYDIELFDLKKNHTAWTGQITFTSQNEINYYNFKELAKDIVYDLKEKGHIRKVES